MTSCIDWPRTASGDCSPSAQSTASVTLDFPEPFGPTMTDTPSPNSSRVRSGNDLKPFRLIDLRCISSARGVLFGGVVLVAPQLVQGDPRGLLLGRLLRAPRAAPDHPRAHAPFDVEDAVVRRPVLGDDLVVDDLALLGEALLECRLEVHRVLERLLDLRHEHLDDR